MKVWTILILVFLISACSGGGQKSEVDQYELYGKKRVDCKTTKTTDQGANVIQCPEIRADDKEIQDEDNLQQSYSPEDYNDIY